MASSKPSSEKHVGTASEKHVGTASDFFYQEAE